MRSTTGGGLVVVLRDESRNGVRELLGERRSIGSGRKPDLAIEGEGRDPLAGLPGADQKRTDVADKAGCHGEHPECGEAVGRAFRVRLDRGERGRRDDIRRRGRAHQPLGHVASTTFLDELDQAVPLEGPQVVVDLLPRKSDPGRQGRRGPGGRELREETRADRIQRCLGGCRVLDDRDVEHAATLPPTRLFVKTE